MVALRFSGYHTESMKFSKNSKYSHKKNLELEPEIGVKIIPNADKATIALSVTINGNNAPFNVFVEIIGNFTFDVEEGENLGLDFHDMLKVNGVAIMYPYLRAQVTSLTAMANEFKPYILPTINLAQNLSEVDE